MRVRGYLGNFLLTTSGSLQGSREGTQIRQLQCPRQTCKASSLSRQQPAWSTRRESTSCTGFSCSLTTLTYKSSLAFLHCMALRHTEKVSDFVFVFVLVFSCATQRNPVRRGKGRTGERGSKEVWECETARALPQLIWSIPQGSLLVILVCVLLWGCAQSWERGLNPCLPHR